MKKLLLLIRVLRRCGHAAKKEQAEPSLWDRLSGLLTPVLGILVVAGMFFVGQFLAQHQDRIGTAATVFPTILMLGGVSAFLLCVPQVINQLYMSHDLDQLITLPLTEVQLVVAKLASAGSMPMLLCCGLIIPCGVGFGVTAGCFDAVGWVALVLGAVILGLCMISLAGVLMIVIIRCFPFVRSRNAISMIGSLIAFALVIGYLMIDTSGLSGDKAEQTLGGLSSSLSGVTQALPIIGLTVKAMTGGGLLPLAEALGIALAAAALLFIVAKLFYISAALNMQDAAGSKVRMSNEDLRRSTRASGVHATLLRRELKTIVRTPALLTNGYLYSIVMPFIVWVPFAIKFGKQISEDFAAQDIPFTVETFRELIEGLDVTWQTWCLAAVGIVLFMVAMSVSVSVLSYGCISLEGKDYSVLKTLPVPMETIVMVKRDAAMLFNGISSVLIPTIAAAVLAVLGLIPAWAIAVVAVDGGACLVLAEDICCLRGLRKPNLNWNTEATACKNNVPGLFILFASLAIVVVGLMKLMDAAPGASVMTALALAACIAPIVAAIVLDMSLHAAASKLGDRV